MTLVQSLHNLKLMLMRVANSQNTCKKNKDLAYKALNSIRETIRKYENEETQQKTINSLWEVFGPKPES